MRSERDHRWRGRTGRWRPLLRTAAFGVLVSACAVAPAGESERATDEALADDTATTAPPVTLGSLRATIEGALGDVDPDVTLDERADDDPPDDVVLVGDSVLALVTDDIARRLPSTLHVDAADCRRIDMPVTGPCGGVPSGTVVDDGIAAMSATVAATDRRGVEPEAAVIVLANNSSLDPVLLDEAMTVLADIPRVWWVTTRIDGFGRQDPNNALLVDLAERDERAGVVDWFAHSEGQEWLADHVHPNPTGEQALAALIARHLRCDCVP